VTTGTSSAAAPASGGPDWTRWEGLPGPDWPGWQNIPRPEGPAVTLLGLVVGCVLAGAGMALVLRALRGLPRGERLALRGGPWAWAGFGVGVAVVWAQTWPRGSSEIALALAGLGAALLWFMGRDVAWGLWVRRRVPEGAQLRVGDMEGRVRALRARGLELESEGWVRHVPYRALLGPFSVRRDSRRSVFPVQLELPVPTGTDLGGARQRLREWVLCSPWASLDVPPRVEVVGATDEPPRFRVQAATFVPEGVSQLQAHVRGAWSDGGDRAGPVATDRAPR
jgi:hypothetical protein